MRTMFPYINLSNVYIVATISKNSKIAMLFTIMHRIFQVIQEYFKEVEAESVRDNFLVCFELMDKLIDFGYTDAKILQEYITQVTSWNQLQSPTLSPEGLMVSRTGRRSSWM